MPVPPFQEGGLHALEDRRKLLLHIALAVGISRKIEQSKNGPAFAGSVDQLEARRAHTALLGFQHCLLILVLEHKVEVELRVNHGGLIHGRNEERLLSWNLPAEEQVTRLA